MDSLVHTFNTRTRLGPPLWVISNTDHDTSRCRRAALGDLHKRAWLRPGKAFRGERHRQPFADDYLDCLPGRSLVSANLPRIPREKFAGTHPRDVVHDLAVKEKLDVPD